MLSKLIDRIDLLRETLTIGIRLGRLAAVLRSENRPRDLNHTPDADAPTPIVPALLKRTGKETRLLIDGTGGGARPDPSLHKLLARAYRYNDLVM